MASSVPMMPGGGGGGGQADSSAADVGAWSEGANTCTFALWFGAVVCASRESSKSSSSSSTAAHAGVSSTPLLSAVVADFWRILHTDWGLSSHIWQQQAPQVRLVNAMDIATPPAGLGEHPVSCKCTGVSESCVEYVHGHMCYGDNVDDEWLVVAVLRELTLRWRGLVCHVADADGDLVLIEAALHIPPWLKPSNSQHRVALAAGEVHIVPQAFPRDDSQELTLAQTGHLVTNDAVATRASAAVQECINRRLQDFPKTALDSVHRVRCRLPVPVARLLQQEPALIAPAVTTFYSRDAGDVQAAARMRCFGVKPDTYTMVTFTRCLYAQLSQQRFFPPKAFAKHMPEASSSDYAACELGMKLACGFEMVMQQGPGSKLMKNAAAATAAATTKSTTTGAAVQGKTASAGTAAAVSSPPAEDLLRVRGTGRWKAYLAALQRAGYFEGLTEGTVRYRRRLDEAAAALVNRSAASQSGEEPAHPSVRMFDLLQAPFEWPQWPPLTAADDDDSWLTSGADLARRLQEHGGSTTSQDGGASAAEAAATAATAAAANDVVRSMGQFVNNMSGLEGVVGGGDGDSSDSDSLASTDDDEDETGELKDVVLDMNKLMAVLAGTDIGTTGAAGGAGAAGEATAATAAATNDATLNSGEDAGSVHTHATTSGAAAALTMGDIMSHMDRVLDGTTLGKSFERVPSSEAAAAAGDEGNAREATVDRRDFTVAQFADDDASDDSDDDAGGTADPGVGEHKRDDQHSQHTQHNDSDSSSSSSSDDDDDDTLPPVNLDLNLVRNIMAAVGGQAGLAGPASNVLGELGVQVPAEWRAAPAAGTDNGDASDT